MTGEQIQELRHKLGDSVEAFGKRFHRCVGTVNDWEQGRRNPDKMVLAAMRMLAMGKCPMCHRHVGE